MRNRALIALITLCVALFGGVAVTQLREELTPSVQLPQLVVMTDDDGASPEVIRNTVSTPIETALRDIQSLKKTSSVSSSGRSLVTAEFAFGTNLDVVQQQVDVALDAVKPDLPADVTPRVLRGSLSDLPVLELGVTGGSDTAKLAADIDRLVLPKITKADGVSDAELVGAAGQRVTITPNASKLAKAGLTTSAVVKALQQRGGPVAAGSLDQGGTTRDVQAGVSAASVDDIKKTPVVGGARGRTPKTIGDVATVVLAHDPDETISRIDGKPGIAIAVTKLPGANTVAVSDAVKKLVPTLESRLGGHVKITPVFDQGPFITQSIGSLAEDGVLGLGFAALVILVFLASMRSTVVTLVSIPASLLITLIALWGGGLTLNILTLGGLTIAIGRVVDDSIVVIENIKRHLVPGAERAPAIVRAVGEVAGAITASTITTVAVFLPIAFIGGATGQLFRPFAITVAVALLASLLVALTIVPVLAYWLLRPRHGGLTGDLTHRTAAAAATLARASWTAPITIFRTFAGAFPHIVGGARMSRRRDLRGQRSPLGRLARLERRGRLAVTAPILLAPYRLRRLAQVRSLRGRVDEVEPVGIAARAPAADEFQRASRLQRGYLPIIRWTLAHSGATVLLAFAVLEFTAALVPMLTTNFLGDTGQNTLSITQSLAPGASLSAKSAAAEPVEKALLHTRGVKTVQTSVGGSGSALADAFTGSGPKTTFSVTTDMDADQLALQNTISRELRKLSGSGSIAISSAGQTLIGAGGLEIDVTAPDDAALRKASAALVRQLDYYPSLTGVSSDIAAALPYVSVEPKRAAAAKDGLTGAALDAAVAQAMQPTQIGSIELDGSSDKIYLVDPKAPTTAAQLKSLKIATAVGPVTLSSLATVRDATGPTNISTQDGLRSARITAEPVGQDLTQANNDVAAALATVELPTGVEAVVGGEQADQSDAFSQLGLALLAAILIVYIVMVATFKSLRQPLLLLVSVPFAATGAVGLQLLSGIPLGVASLIGVLMLIGIVVTNAIVLIDLVNKYRAQGMSVADAVIHGAARRLRPILMTAFATVLALTPMAVGLTGHGSFISQPLAIVVIGGLVSSTVLTLVVLPTLYNLVEGVRERREAKARQADSIGLAPLVLPAAAPAPVLAAADDAAEVAPAK